ncbi:hypothetical protein MKO06_16820 [Gramella sp. GC03-9]|uniref:Prenyltransferase n=1 Tax=Christiangramia oceanisediminis TaxID=2920386 RepID=A0A9X2L0G9_9FLAO|nr:hypothetical protein [Gramella oceanisediminis]MCP9201576.1 hypothetical protein [Gramella oceanisediminis]
MNYLRNAFELYINSSIHVSLAVIAFTIITFLNFDIPIDADLCLFIFFASITGYNFVKYAGIAKLHHSSLAGNLRIIQIFSFLCFIALAYYCFQQKAEVIIASGILGLFTLLYAVPFLGPNKNLRSLSGLKIFVIAVVWAGTTVLLPLINEGKVFDLEIIIDFLQRLVFVIVLTLPFEIRDLKYDSGSLETIPQRLGIRSTKIFGSILILLIIGVEIFQNSFQQQDFMAMFICLLLSGWFLWRSKINQGKYDASFWVESLPVLYLGIYLILRHYPLHIPF